VAGDYVTGAPFTPDVFTIYDAWGYDARFGIGLTAEEKADLAAFLLAL
jgi:hypothetical protein